jgi:hypothetical protein
MNALVGDCQAKAVPPGIEGFTAYLLRHGRSLQHCNQLKMLGWELGKLNFVKLGC